MAVTAGEVAKAGGASLEELRREADRGHAMRVMCSGARHYAVKLQKEGAIQGIIGMGGGGGTSIAATAMQGLPLGFPKVCITTLASGDTREYVGTRDIVLFPSIVDICGINRFSAMVMSRAVWRNARRFWKKETMLRWYFMLPAGAAAPWRR